MDFKKLTEQSVNNIRKSWPAKTFRDEDFYAHWLAQTYYFVRHSTPLLGFALPHLKDEKLRHIFEHHLGEESRHDLLALKDLEKLGRTPAAIGESLWTKSFYQCQYYRIQFEGGSALLGYILFLEALAVTIGKEVYEEVNTIHKGATLFLKVHAEEDVSHVARAVALIETLSPAEQEVIVDNFRASEALYLAILEAGPRRQQRNVA